MNTFLLILIRISYLISIYTLVFWFLTLTERDIFKKSSKRVKDWPTVSVLIPAYNEEKTIKKCVLSALNLDYPKDKLNVIVVNDGSTDKTADIVKSMMKKFPNLKLINLKNGGKAHALNTALKQVNSEFFACLDADSFVDKKTLKKMIRVFKSSDEKLAVVIPAMKVYKPKTILQKIQDIEYNTSILLNRLLSELDSAYVAPGPFSIYRTEVVKKIGGFDENSLTEDQEIAYRLQKNMYHLKQCPEAWVFTSTPKNGREFFKQRKRWDRGGIQTWWKYRELMFNPKYGNFGVMQMPLIIIRYLMGILALVSSYFFYIRPLIKLIHNLNLVGWDLRAYWRDAFRHGLFHNFSWLNLNFVNLFFIITSLTGTLILVFYAFKYTKEGWKLGRLLVLIPYIALYYLLQSIIVVVAFTETILNRRKEW